MIFTKTNRRRLLIALFGFGLCIGLGNPGFVHANIGTATQNLQPSNAMVQQAFNDLFARQLSAVYQTPTRDDDLALARTMLDAAKSQVARHGADSDPLPDSARPPRFV